jgi:hypothetical protein
MYYITGKSLMADVPGDAKHPVLLGRVWLVRLE